MAQFGAVSAIIQCSEPERRVRRQAVDFYGILVSSASFTPRFTPQKIWAAVGRQATQSKQFRLSAQPLEV
jgi:hypothetical protein